MPADGNYSSPLISFANKFSHPVKRNAIQINRLVQFDATQFPTIQCREISGYIVNITPSRLIFPTDSVSQIILMAEQESLFRKFFQILKEVDSFAGGTGVRRKQVLRFGISCFEQKKC